MAWQPIVDVVGILLGIGSLIASILAYRQAEEAARDSRKASEEAAEAAEKSREAIELLRRDVERGTILELLSKVETLSLELETLFSANLYPSVLLRARDISKELVYLIGRWNDALPGEALAVIADSNAKIEQLRDRLQQTNPLSSKEHARLFGVIQPVVKSLATERARAQKRKEENGRHF